MTPRRTLLLAALLTLPAWPGAAQTPTPPKVEVPKVEAPTVARPTIQTPPARGAAAAATPRPVPQSPSAAAAANTETDPAILSDRIGELVDQVSQLQTENGVLTGRIEGLNRSLEEKNAEIVDLRDHARELQAALTAAEASRAELAATVKDAAVIEDNTKQMREELASAQASLAAGAVERQNLEDQLASVTAALEEARKAASEAADKAQNAAAIKLASSAKVEEAQLAAQAAQAKAADLLEQRTIAIVAAVIAGALAVFAFFRGKT